MATRCRIGYREKDGTIVSAYSHYDGYPSHTGKILLKRFRSFESVKELCKTGEIAQLTETEETTINSDMWRKSKDSLDYIRAAYDNGCEYAYLFETSKMSPSCEPTWFFLELNEGGLRFKLLRYADGM